MTDQHRYRRQVVEPMRLLRGEDDGQQRRRGDDAVGTLGDIARSLA